MKISMISLPALIIAAIAFVVLYVILGVTLWVSFVVAGGALLLWTLIYGGAAIRRSGPHGHAH